MCDYLYIIGTNIIQSYDNTKTTPNIFQLTDFTPGIYVRTYLDNIFHQNGFTYSFDDNDLEQRINKLEIS